MTRAKISIIAVWIVSVLLALAFILAGTPKLLRVDVWVCRAQSVQHMQMHTQLHLMH